MARDTFHDAVRRALEKEGWVITHDPLRIAYGSDSVYVDIGAQRHVLAAEKGEEKIAVEIKSFLRQSGLADFEQALGQYIFYEKLLQRFEPDRVLWLGVPAEAYEETISRPIVQVALRELPIKMAIYDKVAEEIIEWIAR